MNLVEGLLQDKNYWFCWVTAFAEVCFPGKAKLFSGQSCRPILPCAWWCWRCVGSEKSFGQGKCWPAAVFQSCCEQSQWHACYMISRQGILAGLKERLCQPASKLHYHQRDGKQVVGPATFQCPMSCLLHAKCRWANPSPNPAILLAIPLIIMQFARQLTKPLQNQNIFNGLHCLNQPCKVGVLTFFGLLLTDTVEFWPKF